MKTEKKRAKIKLPHYVLECNLLTCARLVQTCNADGGAGFTVTHPPYRLLKKTLCFRWYLDLIFVCLWRMTPPVHPNSHPVAHEHLPQSLEYTNLQPCKKDVCVPVVLLQSLQDKLQRKNAPRPLAICPSEAGWVSAWVCLLPSSLLYIPTPTPTPAPIYLAYIQAIKHACPAPHFHSAYVKYITEMSWSPGEMTESATDHNETLPLACMWRKREDGEER